MHEQEKSADIDELDAFIVEENEPADKKLLASIIMPYVVSMGKNKVVDYTEKYEQLETWKKMLICLSCRKIMQIKGILEEEAAGPKEISEQANISLDSAKEISRNNRLKGLIYTSKSGYYIPNYRLKKVKEALLGSKEGKENG